MQFNPEERDKAQQIYREAILCFVENKRLEEVLGQGEIGRLQGSERFRTLMHGLLPVVVHLCRRSHRADTKLGVLVLIHFCADNNDGLCRLPVARFAQILGRDARNVQSAIDDLDGYGEIGVHRVATGNSYYPKIARVVLDTAPALGWFLDTFSDKPRPVGRPKKPYGADAVSFGEVRPSTKNDTAQIAKPYGADAIHRRLSEVSNKRSASSRTVRGSAPTPQSQAHEARP